MNENPYRDPDRATFHAQVLALKGKRVKVCCSSFDDWWEGILLEVGADYIRVEDPDDPLTIIQLRNVSSISDLTDFPDENADE